MQTALALALWLPWAGSVAAQSLPEPPLPRPPLPGAEAAGTADSVSQPNTESAIEAVPDVPLDLGDTPLPGAGSEPGSAPGPEPVELVRPLPDPPPPRPDRGDETARARAAADASETEPATATDVPSDPPAPPAREASPNETVPRTDGSPGESGNEVAKSEAAGGLAGKTEIDATSADSSDTRIAAATDVPVKRAQRLPKPPQPRPDRDRPEPEIVVPDIARLSSGNVLFDRADTNGDLRLSWTEIAADRRRRHGEFDRDTDGSLTYEEYADQSLPPGLRQVADRLLVLRARRFARYDADSDGLVSGREYIAAGTDLFDLMDRNGDGLLDPKEYGLEWRPGAGVVD